MSARSMLTAWSSLRRFQRLDRADREIVVYAESRADWPHLGPIVEELTGALGRSLSYVTSDEDDPLLSDAKPNIQAFYVGSGSTRTTFFRLLDAGVMLMTLPDLETYHLKRSVHPVHYVYVFHSMVSTHMIYRKGAFDAFDTILCVGPHHEAEIRRTEEVYGLKAKELVPHGYARLDAIMRTAGELARGPSEPGEGRRLVLAPSWGECSFIEAPAGPALIDLLLGARHTIVLRLHPMTVRRFPKLAGTLAGQFQGRPFRVEVDMREQASLHESELMIGDWSGAALEYAFGRERPVVFVDMPMKVNNPEYERIGLKTIEESIRDDIGAIVDPNDLHAALPLVEALCGDPDAFRERLRETRERAVYNVGRSASIGAAEVARLADGARAVAEARTGT
ncbi:MAG TPA: CDP-glycerol--glycerophosphate glycerophosphotransferase [Candidatus Limnocylindria bacterium]